VGGEDSVHPTTAFWSQLTPHLLQQNSNGLESPNILPVGALDPTTTCVSSVDMPEENALEIYE
jgi:hypothetical protein